MMPMDTIEHLTALLMTEELRGHLSALEDLAPGLGFALKVTFADKRPVVFANPAMPVGKGGVIQGGVVLANLSNPSLNLEMSIVIHPAEGVDDRNRSDLILGALQVLDLLDREISVPVAA